MRSLFLGLLLLLLAGAALAQDETEALFKARCAKCHGTDGSGRTPAGKRLRVADLRSSQVQKRSDDELFRTIAYGSKHRNYPHVFTSQGVSEAQVRMLVRYIRGFAPNSVVRGR